MLLQARENNLMATTRQINTTASSEIMQRIGTKVTLDLYEKSVITSFFYNAESWTLTRTEEKQIDKIQAIKRLFNLPITTPSAAVPGARQALRHPLLSASFSGIRYLPCGADRARVHHQ